MSDITNLTYDQESYFKQQLLKYSIHDELQIYFNNPESIKDTLFVKFLFDQLTTIPLLTSKATAKQKFQQLIQTLPNIVIKSQMASKQETTDHFRKFVVKVFDVALRTPLEKKKDKTLKIFKDPAFDPTERKAKLNENQYTTEDREEMKEEEEKEKKKSAKDIERDETILKLQRRLTEITQIIMMKVESKNMEYQKNNSKDTTDFIFVNNKLKENEIDTTPITPINPNETSPTSSTSSHTSSNNNNESKSSKSEEKGENDENGISHIFNLILNTKHFKDLPEEFNEFFTINIKIMALWMERELRDPKQVVKVKRLYMITPVKAIRASLAIANPITLLKGFILLFLAKPFGARNLIQTIAAVLVEIGKTDKATKKALKDLENSLSTLPNRAHRKLLIQKMKGFVQNPNGISNSDGVPIAYFKDVPEALAILQYQWQGSPPIDSSIIATLEEDHFNHLFEYVKLEKRKREKNDFVDILGNDEMIDIIRELLPVLYEPLGKLFCKANVGYHFEKIAYCMKKIVTAAETGELIDEDDQDLEMEDTTGLLNDLDQNTASPASSTGGDSDTSSPVDSSRVSNEKKKGSAQNLFSKLGWLKPSNWVSHSAPTSPVATSTPPVQEPTDVVIIDKELVPGQSPQTTQSVPVTPTLSDVKKKFKKDKSQAITMGERLALFEEVNYVLMERIYDMIHDLVLSDAKMNANPSEKSGSTGLLSQSVCWMLGLLQFLKDEVLDINTLIFQTLSPDLKAKVVDELNQVVEYRNWRLEHGNQEATKKNIEKVDKQGLDLKEEVKKEKEEGPPKPKLVYIPTLTTPFIEIMRERLNRLGDPSKYSLVNLSSAVTFDYDKVTSDDEDDINNNNNNNNKTTTTTSTTTTSSTTTSSSPSSSLDHKMREVDLNNNDDDVIAKK